MVTFSCCVTSCKNTGRNSNCKFYSFPTAKWKLEQREKWINAVKRKNADGSPWTPKRSSYICSAHFVGGKKSEEMASLSYTPTIFPSIYKNSKIGTATVLSRHKHFMGRRLRQKPNSMIVSSVELIIPDNNEMFIENLDNADPLQIVQDDKECQVNLLQDSNETGKTFNCNRYIYVNSEKCDAEIQTDIMDIRESKIVYNQKKYNNQRCSSPKRVFFLLKKKSFIGCQSIQKD